MILVECTMCGRKVPKSEAFISCDGKNSRPMWLCADCDKETVIDHLENYGRY